MPYVLGWNKINIANGWTYDTNPEAVAPPDDACYGFHFPSRSVLNAWGGGAYDSQRHRLWFWGGGHGDYFGNEVYYYDVAARQTVRYTDPSPSSSWNCPSLPTGSDAYLDGRPCSRHTYHQIEYLPVQDRLFMYGGSKAGGSGGFGFDVWTFDPDNIGGALAGWEYKGIITNNPGAAMVGVAWDDTVARLWVFAMLATNHSLRQYDPATDTFTVISANTGNPVGTNVNMNIGFDPVRKVIYVIGLGFFGWISVAPGSTYTFTAQATTGGSALIAEKAPGLAYDPVIGKMVGWTIIGGNGNTIYTLNHDTWVWTATTYSSPTPGPVPTGVYANASGQYGRWQYSSLIDGFIAISDWFNDVHVLKTRSLTASWVPSLQDERDTYDLWGWTRTASDEVTFPAEPGYWVQYEDAVGGGTCLPHDHTEGDDLWENLAMYRRTGQAGFLDAAEAWADFYTNRRTPAQADQESGEGPHCHRYGWGLVDYYIYTGDSAYLNAAIAIAADIDAFWRTHGTGGAWPTTAQVTTWNLEMYGHRQHSRQLLLAQRLAQTGIAQWVTFRNNMIDLWLNLHTWNEAQGIYYVSDGSGAYIGWGLNYAAGDRATDSFGCAPMWDAFYEYYLETGNTTVKSRLIAMAEWYYQHGRHNTIGYGASYLGLLADGTEWYKNTPFWVGWSTIHHVNLLVYAYKLTGLTKYLTEAKAAFNIAVKSEYGTLNRIAPDNEVYKFMDGLVSLWSNNNPPLTGRYRTFLISKGELQYARWLFENGGEPTVLEAGVAPAAPANLRIVP